MLETLPAPRALLLPEGRWTAAEAEQEPPPRAAPSEAQPLPEPVEAERAALPPRPPVSDPAAGDDRGSSGEAAEEPPSRMDAMSLFHGLLAEASRSGVTAPGTSMHIYALVKQLSTLMDHRMEVAA